jgi:lipopolysaccharide/colanic/teichoic acid biosynthesis glycosyltransferase
MDLVIKRPRVLPRQVGYQVTKRIMDIVVCTIILPLALPVLLICALAIYLDSPGPILFVQERIGKGGRPFRLYKFRTMKVDLDDSYCRAYMRAYVRGEMFDYEDGKKIHKPVKGNEIFRVGSILRKTSLDELPQIINVLRGDMSIVGPRPNVLYEVDAYWPWHHERLEVLPGITGLAQVCGRSSIDFASIARKDIEYIEKQCLMLDLKILWSTIVTIFGCKGVM